MRQDHHQEKTTADGSRRDFLKTNLGRVLLAAGVLSAAPDVAYGYPVHTNAGTHNNSTNHVNLKIPNVPFAHENGITHVNHTGHTNATTFVHENFATHSNTQTHANVTTHANSTDNDGCHSNLAVHANQLQSHTNTANHTNTA